MTINCFLEVTNIYKRVFIAVVFFKITGELQRNTDMTTNTETQLVVAIDFGTTYTGYAISTYSDYKIDPLKASTTN